MVETITPAVHGGRARWVGAVALHAAAAAATAAALGATLGLLGGSLGAPWGRAGIVAILAAAVAYALGELGLVRMPIPQLRRQVPDWWRTFFGRSAAAALYGAGLGVGFATYLSNGTLVVVALAAAASGRPAIGAALLAPFGVVRGLSVLLAWRSAAAREGSDLVNRLASGPDSMRRRVNAASLAAVAIVAGVAATRAPAGGFAAFAAAALGVVFAWAALSKIVSARRWRSALATHALPPTLERAAGWIVPIAEAAVLVLVALGSPRAAGIWALALLLCFSLELVRARGRLGARVPCGCFGERDAIPLFEVLIRNAGLAGLGVFVAASDRAAHVIDLPAAPGRSTALPAALAVASLVIAAMLGWRVTVWLTRGIRV